MPQADKKPPVIPDTLAGRILPLEYKGVIELDQNGAVKFWSEGLLESWGLAPKDMLGRELLQHPVFAADPFPKLVAQAARLMHPQPFLIMFDRQDGRRPEASHGVLYPFQNGEDGTLGGMAVAFLRHRPPDRKNRLPDELFRQSFDAASDAISITDINGTILDVNNAFVQLYGYSRRQLIGKNHRLIRADTVDQRVYQDMWRSILDPSIGSWVGEITNIRRDGTMVDVLLSITPIRNQHGNIEGYMGKAVDLSERKRLEARLRLSEEKYRSIIRNAHDGIAIREGLHLIEANEAFAHLVGCSLDDCVGLDMRSLFNEESARVYTHSVIQKARRGEVVGPQFNVIVNNRQGQRRIWHIHERKLPYRDRTVAMIVQDITEDRNRAERLIQQEKLAAIGLLTAGVAHEIGNPLASLSGMIQVWAMEDIDKKIRRRLGEMDAHITRISSIVEQMLDFARPRNLEWQLCDIHAVIRDAIHIASYDRRFRHITIQQNFSEELPPTYAMVEGLRQVFINLIINAVDAMSPDGTLTIGTTFDNGRVYIAFEDTGEGMTEEVQRRAFEPFFTTKQVGKGTGMGLAVSYSLIEKHAGTISLFSTPGQGTTVTVMIPFRDKIDEGNH